MAVIVDGAPRRHLTRHERPAATVVLIVFSRATGERRRVIDCDDDAHYAAHLELMHPGESYLFMSHEEYDSIGGRYEGKPGAHSLNHHVALHAGFSKAPDPHESIHAVVHPDGTVVNMVHADLTCGDSGEHYATGHKLVFCGRGVGIGHRHVNGKFIAPDGE